MVLKPKQYSITCLQTKIIEYVLTIKIINLSVTLSELRDRHMLTKDISIDFESIFDYL